jgi:subtilisin family serine protease
VATGDLDYSYPASYDDMLSVGAIDENIYKASFSQWNDKVTLVAPGVEVWSTLPLSGTCEYCDGRSAYGTMDGTSMATPYVSGIAALLWSSDPTRWTAADVSAAMTNSAEDLRWEGRDVVIGSNLVLRLGGLPVAHGRNGSHRRTNRATGFLRDCQFNSRRCGSISHCRNMAISTTTPQP